ncbi:hypothetical protein chiPu_0019750 [Chiloscyllium punctatum]|uniref:WxxW domain-containing protein n=1 Tax=Chiloscyllium punctatum TaxID=137246 RepID=A0A401RT14_CHIPU|nr:hypothetical protein [Chiloscyllium punctatum]
MADSSVVPVAPPELVALVENTRNPAMLMMSESVCHGEWSPWINQNTPTISKPKDVELLFPIMDMLCPHSEDVENIQCQYVSNPGKPLSESADHVICDSDLGLVCKVSKSTSRKICDDYEIRVCCKPHMMPGSTTISKTTKSGETSAFSKNDVYICEDIFQ